MLGQLLKRERERERESLQRIRSQSKFSKRRFRPKVSVEIQFYRYPLIIDRQIPSNCDLQAAQSEHTRKLRPEHAETKLCCLDHHCRGLIIFDLSADARKETGERDARKRLEKIRKERLQCVQMILAHSSLGHSLYTVVGCAVRPCVRRPYTMCPTSQVALLFLSFLKKPFRVCFKFCSWCSRCFQH